MNKRFEENKKRPSHRSYDDKDGFKKDNSGPKRGGGFSDRKESSRGGSRGGFKKSGGYKSHSYGKNRAYIDESRFISKAKDRKIVEYIPKTRFCDLPINESLKKSIEAKGYEKPTLIQDKAILPALEGNDLIGIANTGTGKTAAFLIPLIDKVLNNKKEKVLIIAPTRELAEQISGELAGFSKGMKLFSALAVGGMNIGSQIMNIRKGVSFVIGTPGRINDLINRKVLKLEEFGTLVLDEADRMLDMGFIGEVRDIFGKMPEKKQVLFFSATFEREIQRLADDFLKNPIKIEAKTGETAENVDQDVVKYSRYEEKMDTLHNLLIEGEFKKVLIFGETKMGVEEVCTTLKDRGFKAVSIHGDKSQRDRRLALKMFKEEKAEIMVATDVAARGLDIPEVTHVINYDIPHTYEDYVHRIGRTGRASSKGIALTFVKESMSFSGDKSERGDRNRYKRGEKKESRPTRPTNRRFRK